MPGQPLQQPGTRGQDAHSDGPRRHKAEQTRQLLLRAGVELARERVGHAGDEVVSAALAHVRLTQVADRATALRRADGDTTASRVTTGAVYNLWPSQADFQADLLFHIAGIQATLTPGMAETAERFRHAARRGVPFDQVLAELVGDIQGHYRSDPLFPVELGFLASAGDPRVAQALRRRREAFLADADQLWQAVLDAYGLRVRPSYQLRHLTLSVAAQIVGSVVLWYANPGTGPGGDVDLDGTLTIRSIAAVFDAFTMADDEPGGTDPTPRS